MKAKDESSDHCNHKLFSFKAIKNRVKALLLAVLLLNHQEKPMKKSNAKKAAKKPAKKDSKPKK